MYSEVIDCKTIAFKSEFYIDTKYNEAKHFVRDFLTEESYMNSTPKVNNDIRDKIIVGLFGNQQEDAIKAIKKYSNFNATFNAHTILDFGRKYAVAEVGGRILLGAFSKIVSQPLIKSLVGKVLGKFVTQTSPRPIIALGIDNSFPPLEIVLEPFAKEMGALFHKEWKVAGLYDDNVVSEGFDKILEAVLDKTVKENGKILFTTKGFEISKAVAKKGLNITEQGYTNYEFNLIMSNPKYLKITTFYDKTNKIIPIQTILNQIK